MIYSYDVAYWANPNGYCNYTIKYFPKSHTTTLEVGGIMAKDHAYYMQIILPRFYHFRNVLLSFDREKVVEYLKGVPIKAVVIGEPRGPEIEAQKSLATDVEVETPVETVESLEKQIKSLIKKEKYEKVAIVQAKLEEILKKGN